MDATWNQVMVIVGSNIALIIVMFGTTIAMWLHSDKKIEAIQKEMADFHGRLERQDAEFKAHLHYHNAIEERNKAK